MVGFYSMTKINPLHPVTVTPAREPFRSAYIGQAIHQVGGEIYGGVLCTVTAGGDIDEANMRAGLVCDAWNATINHRIAPGAGCGVPGDENTSSKEPSDGKVER